MLNQEALTPDEALEVYAPVADRSPHGLSILEVTQALEQSMLDMEKVVFPLAFADPQIENNWQHEKLRIRDDIDHEYMEAARNSLREITSESGLGVFASNGVLFKGAVFGRDSIETDLNLMDIAEHLDEETKQTALNIIKTLGSKQGIEWRDINDEAPGKIMHEFRCSTVDGKPLAPATKLLYDKLAREWGGNEEEVIYYGSVDATPMFVMLVNKFASKFGEEYLDLVQVTNRAGEEITLREVTRRALECLKNEVDPEPPAHNPTGLHMYETRNKEAGQPNQAWEDSQEAYVHEDGTPINHNCPVVSTDVQAYTYDAFRAAAHLFPEERDEYMRQARQIQQKTLELLWMPDKQYFAMGMDYDEEKSEYRQIRTLNANGAQLLNSNILKDLPADKQQLYVAGLVKMIMSDEFLTDGGIRVRAKSQADLVPFWDYHGSHVTWPKQTHAIANGLREWGFLRLAEQLDNRVYNVLRSIDKHLEFIYIDDHDRLLLELDKEAEDAIEVEGTNTPEKDQAWTIASVLSMIYDGDTQPGTWQYVMEQEYMGRIKHVSRINERDVLNILYPRLKYKVWSSNPHKSTFWIDELHAKETIAEARVA